MIERVVNYQKTKWKLVVEVWQCATLNPLPGWCKGVKAPVHTPSAGWQHASEQPRARTLSEEAGAERRPPPNTIVLAATATFHVQAPHTKTFLLITNIIYLESSPESRREELLREQTRDLAGILDWWHRQNVHHCDLMIDQFPTLEIDQLTKFL